MSRHWLIRLWSFVVIYGHSWFFVVIHGFSWSFVAFHGRIWPSEFGGLVAVFGHKKLPTLGELLNHLASEFRPKPDLLEIRRR